ncbi:PQQ-binding-like beta-propeller repeat protein [Haloarcula laminariae]|uniref:outer membrane protein assembly factor BamB family protein n=1 Tax=Haloarcula laminariae TaxID=2961577 RepID=UPI0021C5A8D4|nr:PQQ-binding-like beta-propeller repeat protein [Halomicroarcula laminariae]
MSELDNEEFKEFLYNLTPEEFENFVAQVWSERGWTANVTQMSGDSGIDIVATKESPFQQKQLIQAKRYGPDTAVSSPDIQQYASLRQQENNVDSVVVVTSSRFSKQAVQLAEKLNVKLVSGEELYELFKTDEFFHILSDYSQDTHHGETKDMQTSDAQAANGQGEEVGSTVSRQPFGSSITVKWKAETGEGFAKMVYQDDSIYLGGSDNHLFAIECGAGVTQWSVELPHSIQCIATSGEDVYVGCKDYQVYSVDRATGEGNWSFRSDGYLSAIDVANGIVCCRAETHDYSELYAIDAETGEKLWSFEDGAGTHFGHITIDGGSVYYSSLHTLFSIDLSSGEVQWEFGPKDRSTKPAVHGDSIYVCSDANNQLYAIDADSGAEQWSYDAPGEIHSSPRVLDGTVYIGSGESRLYAVDSNNGSERWSFSAKGPVTLPPVVTGTTLNCASALGYIYAVNPNEGTLIEENEFDGDIYAMTADDTTVYVLGESGDLTALESPD